MSATTTKWNSLTVQKLSQILTLLDRCVELKNDKSKLCGANITTLNQIETQFIIKALNSLNLSLATVGHKVGLQDDILFIYDTNTNQRLIYEDVCAWITEIEKVLFDRGSEFDHKSVVESMVLQAIDVIAELCDYFPKSKLEEIHCEPIIAEKSEYGLAQFELSFSGGGSVVIYPSPKTYHSEHFKLWNDFAPKPNRLHRDFYYRCYQSPMHELIHCLQSIAKIDFDSTSWKSEHDASRVETNLFVAVIGKLTEMSKRSPSSVPPALQPLTEGLFEEIFLYNLSLLSKHLANCNTKLLEGYGIWRDSFGRKSPQDDKDAWSQFSENAAFVRSIKNCISIEAYKENSNITQELLNAYFHPDVNVREQQENNPQTLQITEWRKRLEPDLDSVKVLRELFNQN